MTLKQQMAADVATVFLNEDDFAERGTYYPVAVQLTKWSQ